MAKHTQQGGPATAGPDLLDILRRGFNPHWVANAAITGDIEALRAICLHYADWWNGLAWPAIAAAFGGDEVQALDYLGSASTATPSPITSR